MQQTDKSRPDDLKHLKTLRTQQSKSNQSPSTVSKFEIN